MFPKCAVVLVSLFLYKIKEVLMIGLLRTALAVIEVITRG